MKNLYFQRNILKNSFFYFWKEKLYYLHRSNFKSVKSNCSLTFIDINLNNYFLIENIRGKKYVKQFKYQLSLGDYGVYALENDKIVGYGWVKHSGSKDYFYKFSDDICYLCRFFVIDAKRGYGIYPELISKLIESKACYNNFYINVEKGNIASERGLIKVGFRLDSEYTFFRALKHTFNKKMLTQKQS